MDSKINSKLNLRKKMSFPFKLIKISSNLSHSLIQPLKYHQKIYKLKQKYFDSFFNPFNIISSNILYTLISIASNIFLISLKFNFFSSINKISRN